MLLKWLRRKLSRSNKVTKESHTVVFTQNATDYVVDIEPGAWDEVDHLYVVIEDVAENQTFEGRLYTRR